ncbi:DUF7674 family protein, partial [Paenibacillus aceris]
RRKATELFDIRFGTIFHETIYDVFQTLSDMVKEAHHRGDVEQLKKIYEYAEWCSNQRAEDLWNAAGVFFYEHLVDVTKLLTKQFLIGLSQEYFAN